MGLSRPAVRASTAPDLALTLIGTGFPFKAIHRLDEYLAGLGAVLRDTAGVRRGGSAALDLCHVAEGTLTAFWELSLSPWDWAGGLAILSEAASLPAPRSWTGIAAHVDAMAVHGLPSSLVFSKTVRSDPTATYRSPY